jgi:hypothetical protein
MFSVDEVYRKLVLTLLVEIEFWIIKLIKVLKNNVFYLQKGDLRGCPQVLIVEYKALQLF